MEFNRILKATIHTVVMSAVIIGALAIAAETLRSGKDAGE